MMPWRAFLFLGLWPVGFIPLLFPYSCVVVPTSLSCECLHDNHDEGRGVAIQQVRWQVMGRPRSVTDDVPVA
jgi:hypothetical protein